VQATHLFNDLTTNTVIPFTLSPETITGISRFGNELVNNILVKYLRKYLGQKAGLQASAYS
jgi:hypothetical protein